MGRTLKRTYDDLTKAQGTHNFVALYEWFVEESTLAQYNDAKNWYFQAKEDITRIAEIHGYQPVTCMAIAAVLSVKNSWYGTLADLEAVLIWNDQGRPTELPRTSTYRQQAAKAKQLLDVVPSEDAMYETYIPIIHGQKTCAFFDSLRGVSGGTPCIDRHMVRAFLGMWVRDPKIGKHQYQQIANACENARMIVNRELSSKWLSTREFQAILWVAQIQKNNYRDIISEVA